MTLRINFEIANISNKMSAEAETGFNEVFEEIEANEGNQFFIIRGSLKTPPSTKSIYNGKFVTMPIPPGALTHDGHIINGSTEKPMLIPLLTSIETHAASRVEEAHFCDAFPIEPDVTGTSCIQPDDTLTYFRSEEPLPEIKGNEFLKLYVDGYKLENEGKELYYLVAFTPNNTVQYVVFNDKKDLEDIMEKCRKSIKKGEKYFIGLNGFIIYVDQWDCSIFLANYSLDKVKIGDKKTDMESKIHFHSLKKS